MNSPKIINIGGANYELTAADIGPTTAELTQSLAERFRAIAARSAELPSTGHRRRVISIVTIDDGGESGSELIAEDILNRRECNLIAVILAAYFKGVKP